MTLMMIMEQHPMVVVSIFWQIHSIDTSVMYALEQSSLPVPHSSAIFLAKEFQFSSLNPNYLCPIFLSLCDIRHSHGTLPECVHDFPESCSTFSSFHDHCQQVLLF